MKIGIVGLPNVGKSSLFNLLTGAGAQAEAYPFTTIDANHGMAELPDVVLVRLGQLLSPSRLTPAHIEVVDIAGLIEDAHKGEGLGNRFLAHIRDVHLVLHVLRGFADPQIAHAYETIDPARDYEIIRTELGLADLEITERRLVKQRKRPEAREEVALLERYSSLVSGGDLSVNGAFSAGEKQTLATLGLLLPRPNLVVLNLPDQPCDVDLQGSYRFSARLEEDLKEFSPSERIELRKQAGVDTRGVPGMLEQALSLLGLIRFYTVKGDEVRAWIAARGTSALEAAGKIHSDIAEGFIKAEVVKADDLLDAGSWQEAAHQGGMKIEGKDYVVQDKDVLLIKFR